MNVGNWIDLAAAVGTLAAVVVALWIGIRDGRERDAERRDAEVAQARLLLVTGGTSSGGVATVVFTNHSREPIIELELEEVVWSEDEAKGAPWRVPPTVFGARPMTNVLPPGERFQVPVEFLDPDGERIDIGVGSFTARYSFHDARGLTWRRVTNGQPERVVHPA